MVALGFAKIARTLTGIALAALSVNVAWAGTVKLERDCSYVGNFAKSGRKGLQTLDVYFDGDRSSSKPVVVFIHGGAFTSGDKITDGAVLAPMFVDAGCVYVSVNYRLSPAVRFPAHVEDVASAIAWLRSHVRAYGGDPGRLVLVGHSAGAQLAALVTLDGRYLRKHALTPEVVSGVVLVDGGAFDVASSLLHKKERPVKSPTFSSNPAVWQQASPLSHILNDGSAKNIPPYLIYYLPSTFLAKEQSLKMAQKLKAAGVSVTVREVVDGRKKHATIVESLVAPGDVEGAAILGFIKSFKSR